MESPRKFNDCYFYYYSTCTKGDNCVFRHEPSALGCETMCTAWQQGKCLDKRCKLRHMELRKNRKQIPCYWENQPGGCRKKHCPFMHKNPDARTDGIAPSQPAPPQPASSGAVGVDGVPDSGPLPVAPVVPPPQPQPVPLLWQQQRQVVLDSAILGVLPASSELLGGVGVGVGVGGVGGRRVLAPHQHPHAHPHAHAHDPPPNPYAPLPVDPLVVNFEEESDNESAPSSTPTKTVPDDEQRIARTKSQELLALEKIQAEAAAFYSYDSLPDAKHKITRTNINNKYDKLSLDEIAGKKQPATDRRSSLDFKVLSLEEIRARKKAETIVHSTPITLNLTGRKRKSSTQEINTTTGNKIFKVVRSNSIVYKKVDPNAAATNQSKPEKQVEAEPEIPSRKRTLSEQCIDIYNDVQDELVDDVYEFKRIKFDDHGSSKPRLIRNSHNDTCSTIETESDLNKTDDNDSDTEVQIVSIEIKDSTVDVDLSDEVIDVTDVTETVDLDSSEDDVTDLDIELVKNVPDVVASCHKKADNGDSGLLKDIDAILDDDL